MRSPPESRSWRGANLTLLAAYDVLCIDPTTVTPDSVHAAFHKLVLANHPDTILDPALKRRATAKMIELNEAYATIRAEGFPQLIRAAEPPRNVHSSPQYADRRSSASYWDTDDADTAASPWGRWQPHPDEWGHWRAPPDELDRAFERWMRRLGFAGLIARVGFAIFDSVVRTVVIPMLVGVAIVLVLLILMSI
jgi:curved DNA-binding protein CbpA